MTAKPKSDVAKALARDASRSKTLGLKLGITDRELDKKLKMAIELAQGGGQDLDITFSRVR
jgi:hypothetical protein